MFRKVKLAFLDFKNWLTYSRKLPKTGYINGYVASSGTPFGSGKTLSCIQYLNELLITYDGKWITNPKTKQKEFTRVIIFSNIDLTFSKENFVKIQNLEEYVNCLDLIKNHKEDNINVYSVLFLDEIGCEFNSRNFSKNFTPDFLARLVTCRHYNASIIYTAQDFYMVDKIFRELTTRVFVCSHLWRFYKCKQFTSKDMELLATTDYIRPLAKKRYFAFPELFSLYDSTAAFDAMKKDQINGDYLSREELNEMYAPRENEIYLPKLKKKYKKRR